VLPVSSVQARFDLENAGRLTGELEHRDVRLLKIGLKGLHGSASGVGGKRAVKQTSIKL
jgi:hypothetical protein